MERAASRISVFQLRNTGDSDDTIEQTPAAAVYASASNKVIRPTPLDFANFLPWLCTEYESPQSVTVTSVVQESKAPKAKNKRKGEVLKTKSNEDNILVTNSKLSSSSVVEVPLLVTATFDSKSHLVEVAITEREINIHRKTIQAISFCIPYHCFLTRLTLRWTKLDNILIYEIAKFLSNSYLTHIILDDTCGRPNYDLLLSKESTLNHLSLNRCLIDDDQCKKIAANIDSRSGGATLYVLELGSNFITDVGALAIAESLRRNRNLMHLNLSGNMVTDEGAIPLLSHLMKFPVRQEELMETKKRKRQYVQKKMKIYESCYKEVVFKRKRDEEQRRCGKVQKTDNKVNYKKQEGKSSTSIDREIATEMTLRRVGEFIDPFNESSTISENEWIYCTGNVVLCSLNLAYNNLTYNSFQKIYEVLKYQHDTMASEGLKRIVYFGNQLPEISKLYSEITNYLLISVHVGSQKNHPIKDKPTKQKSKIIKMM